MSKEQIAHLLNELARLRRRTAALERQAAAIALAGGSDPPPEELAEARDMPVYVDS